MDVLVKEGLRAPEDEKSLCEALGKVPHAGTAWYIRVLAGAGAWISAALFVVFLAMVDLFDEEAVALGVGLVLLAGAVFLRRRARGEFLVQLAIATSFAAQCLVIFGVAELTDSEEVGAALVAMALSAALLFLFADPVHRFLSTLVVAGAAVVLLADIDSRAAEAVTLVLVSFATIAAWLSKDGLRGPWADIKAPVAHGLSVALILGTGPQLAGEEYGGGPITAVGFTIAALAVLAHVFRSQKVSLGARPAILAFAATAALGAVTASAAGLEAALLVLLLGFHRRSVVLAGEGVIAFVAFAARYYYALDLTLLEKSAVLAVSGGLFLAAWRFFLRREVAP
jgi:hypothetical protein